MHRQDKGHVDSVLYCTERTQIRESLCALGRQSAHDNVPSQSSIQCHWSSSWQRIGQRGHAPQRCEWFKKRKNKMLPHKSKNHHTGWLPEPKRVWPFKVVAQTAGCNSWGLLLEWSGAAKLRCGLSNWARVSILSPQHLEKKTAQVLT